ncbi:hypothetical protein SS50377_21875 [Spironucleus salmonicida]|uniref:Uncharacterized protein n=1 Tax=Spironucleus salmonicida TaxID=348837 RepID=V6LIN9_9EUKA|nr:hypothetical protein SS50377_21875 [Spironucleus salmonicida]|eukprot:EST44417.1 Hypothetical protein SS50377_15723 [Spironucleus salmonicida]
MGCVSPSKQNELEHSKDSAMMNAFNSHISTSQEDKKVTEAQWQVLDKLQLMIGQKRKIDQVPLDFDLDSPFAESNIWEHDTICSISDIEMVIEPEIPSAETTQIQYSVPNLNQKTLQSQEFEEKHQLLVLEQNCASVLDLDQFQNLQITDYILSSQKVGQQHDYNLVEVDID